MKPFNLAVIGCGVVSRMHFEGHLAHPERVRIAAVCDLDPVQAQQAQQKYEIEQAFTSLAELIDQADWDIGVVCTPTSVRLPVVKALAEAGKHIFVEKPMADNLADAGQLVEICRRAGVRLAVDQNFRYHFPFDHARQLIEEGVIGKVINIAHQELTFRQDRGWRTTMPRHALSVMGIHWFDGFRRVARAEARSIRCQVASSPAIECVGETDIAAQLVFENGVMVSYGQSFSSPLRRSETVIIGEAGALVLHYDGLALYDRRNAAEPKQQWANPYGGPKKPESAFRCLDELLLALTEDREASNSGQDNLKTVALLDAAYQSAAENREIIFREGIPQ